ncbi:MAG: BON domain-containing protein [Myxococcales bacterium]|nr:BON domain-containing protein [Myxococcales bacterium]
MNRPAKQAARLPTRRDTAEKRPTLIVVGEKDAISSVSLALRDLRVALDIRGKDPGSIENDAVGILWIELEPRVRSGSRIEALRETARCPVFAVVSEQASSASIHKLYTAGASSVFEWPKEALLLARCLAEMLALRLVRGKAKKPDTALARTVRAHLKLVTGLIQTPHVDANDGFIRVSGEVDSLPLKREAERSIAGVPGVRGLNADALVVLPTPRSDAEIRRAGREILRGSPEVDSRTISLTVEGGSVTLRGTAEDRRELRRLERLVTGIAGVRNVVLEIEVSRERKAKERRVAGRLTRALASAFPNSAVRVTYFDGVAVAAGTSKTLREKRAVLEFLSDDRAVSRAVDKVDVRP